MEALKERIDRLLELDRDELGRECPVEVEEGLEPFADVDRDRVDRVLVALAGYFTVRGAEPDPPGMPTLRAFQRSQAEVTRAWLRQRLGLD